jgi:hypothetical protein
MGSGLFPKTIARTSSRERPAGSFAVLTTATFFFFFDEAALEGADADAEEEEEEEEEAEEAEEAGAAGAAGADSDADAGAEAGEDAEAEAEDDAKAEADAEAEAEDDAKAEAEAQGADAPGSGAAPPRGKRGGAFSIIASAVNVVATHGPQKLLCRQLAGAGYDFSFRVFSSFIFPPHPSPLLRPTVFPIFSPPAL